MSINIPVTDTVNLRLLLSIPVIVVRALTSEMENSFELSVAKLS